MTEPTEPSKPTRRDPAHELIVHVEGALIVLECAGCAERRSLPTPVRLDVLNHYDRMHDHGGLIQN